MKIQPHELMIGNYVNKGIIAWIGYDNGIQSVGILDSVFSSIIKTVKLSAIEPIPLTEEWLLDFKAYNMHDKYYFDIRFISLGYKVLIVDLNEGFLAIREGKGDNKPRLDDDLCVLVNVNYNNNKLYIHQIQNIYKALTGKQLTKCQ